MERANRTLRESLEEVDLNDRYEAKATLTKIADHWNLNDQKARPRTELKSGKIRR